MRRTEGTEERMMKKIYTVLDARRKQADEQGWREAADNKAAALKAAEQELLQKHPQIGVLCREGKTVYYVYPAGGLQEGTLEQLAGALDRLEAGVEAFRARLNWALRIVD